MTTQTVSVVAPSDVIKLLDGAFCGYLPNVFFTRFVSTGITVGGEEVLQSSY